MDKDSKISISNIYVGFKVANEIDKYSDICFPNEEIKILLDTKYGLSIDGKEKVHIYKSIITGEDYYVKENGDIFDCYHIVDNPDEIPFFENIISLRKLIKLHEKDKKHGLISEKEILDIANKIENLIKNKKVISYDDLYEIRGNIFSLYYYVLYMIDEIEEDYLEYEENEKINNVIDFYKSRERIINKDIKK